MGKKKILIVSGSFYPQNSPRSFRTTELANELARKGNDVTVYFPFRGEDYAIYEAEHNLKMKDIGTLKWKEIDVKGGRIEYLIRRVLRRVLLMLFEWPSIELMFKVSKILKAEKGYDMLISIAVPHTIHWGVAKAWSKDSKIAPCWIADCGDPYMGNEIDTFRKLFYFKYLEKRFCRNANFITIPFEGARAAYYPEFHNKIKVIPQGFRLDKIRIPGYKKNRIFPVFGYAGGFIPGKRDPVPLLNFLSSLDRDFLFIVFTSATSLLLPFKSILGNKLEIKDKIPRDELLVLLAGMDFLINLDNNVRTLLPSKLIDYSITGRPVLNITQESDFKVLLEFMDGDYKGKMILDDPDKYDISNIAETFMQLLDKS
jgi:glycosyltransferase involved in cell wall biosynthesis